LQPPNKNPDIIGGVVHGTVIPLNGGTNPKYIAPYIKSPTNVGVKTKGISKNGFKTIGVPKITGSLILNSEGINESLPSYLYCLDFENRTIYKTNPNVIPVPVKFTKTAVN